MVYAQSQFEIDSKVTGKTVILHFHVYSTEYLRTGFICTTFENEITRDLERHYVKLTSYFIVEGRGAVLAHWPF